MEYRFVYFDNIPLGLWINLVIEHVVQENFVLFRFCRPLHNWNFASIVQWMNLNVPEYQYPPTILISNVKWINWTVKIKLQRKTLQILKKIPPYQRVFKHTFRSLVEICRTKWKNQWPKNMTRPYIENISKSLNTKWNKIKQ